MGKTKLSLKEVVKRLEELEVEVEALKRAEMRSGHRKSCLVDMAHMVPMKLSPYVDDHFDTLPVEVK